MVDAVGLHQFDFCGAGGRVASTSLDRPGWIGTTCAQTLPLQIRGWAGVAGVNVTMATGCTLMSLRGHLARHRHPPSRCSPARLLLAPDLLCWVHEFHFPPVDSVVAAALTYAGWPPRKFPRAHGHAHCAALASNALNFSGRNGACSGREQPRGVDLPVVAACVPLPRPTSAFSGAGASQILRCLAWPRGAWRAQAWWGKPELSLEE
eukprot:363670-Chlamydomonas_euryale.AAC.8